jgi:hypothetical protein
MVTASEIVLLILIVAINPIKSGRVYTYNIWRIFFFFKKKKKISAIYHALFLVRYDNKINNLFIFYFLILFTQ